MSKQIKKSVKLTFPSQNLCIKAKYANGQEVRYFMSFGSERLGMKCLSSAPSTQQDNKVLFSLVKYGPGKGGPRTHFENLLPVFEAANSVQELISALKAR